MRTGILGGSFDPVHYGHLGVARAVADALALDRVLLMPAAQAPLRAAAVLASNSQRAEMLRRALVDLTQQTGERRLELSELELERGGVSYTADTLRALSEVHSAETLIWIVGADQFARLEQWREPSELARLAEWAVYARPGYAWTELAYPRVPGLRAHRVHETAGCWDVSSSEIRARIARGETLTGLVPDKVIEYIRETGLYRA
ncbi:MAG: nicotinate-nucleotide adenylyltransferase [Verrucomicrobia bacterium]|nr:nicotinate-nucleotide adenylyltransferase [Verrucomicrobiota bacterium]